MRIIWLFGAMVSVVGGFVVDSQRALLTEPPATQTAAAFAPNLLRRAACSSGHVTFSTGCCLADKLTVCGGGVTVCDATCPTSTTPAVAAKTTTAKTGCDAGSASFRGGCCAKTSLLDCSGTKLCASACPAAKTATTTSEESAAATTTVASTTPSSTLTSSTSSLPSSTTASTTSSTTSTLSTTRSAVKHSSTPGEAAYTFGQTGSIQATSVPTHKQSASGLSTGVKAGIGLGSAAVFLMLVSLGIFLSCMARRKKQGEKKKIVEVGGDWRRGGYAAALPALARSASRRFRGYQNELSGGRYGNRYESSQGSFAGRYNEMPAVELSGGHDLETKKRLAAIRESIYN